MSEALVKTGSLDSFLSNWDKRVQVADVLIKSGFLPQAFKTPQQVLAVMLTAHELNIPEMEALRSINVIQGKPTISPQLMLALARRSHELADVQFTKTADAVVCTITRKGQSPFTTRFGTSEAKALGLMAKDNYQKQPFVMFQWRALAANLRVTFSDVIAGLYTPEELGADVSVTEEGEQVVVSAHEVVTSEQPVNILTLTSASVNTDTGEILEPKPDPVQVAPGVSSPSFDPRSEVIGFGKYKGMPWVQVDSGYLMWMTGSALGADLKAKAAATLKFKESVEKQREANDAATPSGMIFDDPVADASRRARLTFEASLTACATPAQIVAITKRVDDATKSGQLTLSDSDALTKAIDKRNDTITQEKK